MVAPAFRGTNVFCGSSDKAAVRRLLRKRLADPLLPLLTEACD